MKAEVQVAGGFVRGGRVVGVEVGVAVLVVEVVGVDGIVGLVVADHVAGRVGAVGEEGGTKGAGLVGADEVVEIVDFAGNSDHLFVSYYYN